MFMPLQRFHRSDEFGPVGSNQLVHAPLDQFVVETGRAQLRDELSDVLMMTERYRIKLGCYFQCVVAIEQALTPKVVVLRVLEVRTINVSPRRHAVLFLLHRIVGRPGPDTVTLR
jgi:hypothetical protein